MALWNPSNVFGSNEQMGRRLFDEPMLTGARDQNKSPLLGLDLTHFEEDRGNEYSLDRLGKSGVEKAVARHLNIRCENQGSSMKPKKRFDGWATIRVKDLINSPLAPKFPSWTLVADPIVADPPNDNRFHAHALPPDGFTKEYAAFQLRHHFTKKGKVFDTNGVEINITILNAMPRLSLWERCKVTSKKHFDRLREKLGI